VAPAFKWQFRTRGCAAPTKTSVRQNLIALDGSPELFRASGRVVAQGVLGPVGDLVVGDRPRLPLGLSRVTVSLRHDRAGRAFLRWSPHFYNTAAELAQAIDYVRQAV
jgi:hypothetical protein